MRFGVPMTWREQRNHSGDYYFCTWKVQGYRSKTRKNISYPSLPSALPPTPNGPDVPLQSPSNNLDDVQLSSGSETPSDDASDFCLGDESNEPQLLGQSELNDMVRDIGMAKEPAELLGSRLKSQNLLVHGRSFVWYRHREKEIVSYFDQGNALV